mmetsp:Transcript_8462/g.12487  ORF Transcript_8462/g.12487 Transcript_8462/m.12487 type:complete len:289 (-) Transcript_8462:78-944(-)
MSVLETQLSGDTILLIFGDGTSPALLMALIAGIPLNRVHELNFEPGQIRYDITRESVLKSMPDEPSPLYLEKLARGQNELQRLRDDLNRPKVEDYSSTRPTPVLKEPKKKADISKKRVRVAPSHTTSNSEHLPKAEVSERKEAPAQASGSELLPLFALGTAAALTSASPTVLDEEDREKPDEVTSKLSRDEEDEISQITELSGVENKVSKTPELSSDEDELSLTPELQKMENLVSTAPFDIPEMVVESDLVLKEKKIEDAKNAMEEYLNQDDGGDDWLAQMNSMMEDE